MTGTYLATLAYAAIVAILAVASRRWLGMATAGAGASTAMRGLLRRAVPVIFLLSSSAVLLFGRRLVLRYDPAINPDEAQFAADAMLTHHGWLNWNIIDPTSSGPLNAAILAWPYLFGADITLFSTRLTGLACLFGALTFLFLALRRLSDDCTAVIAIVPAVIFYSASNTSDFVDYSSEDLPVLLLALAVYLFVRCFEGGRLGYLAGAGLVLGLVPFAKFQAAPIAAVIGVFVLVRAAATGWKDGSLRSAALRTAAVAGAALLPALILLVPLALVGGFDDFLKSYFVQRWLIVETYAWQNPLPELIGGVPFFDAYLKVCAAMFAVAIVGVALFVRRIGVLPAIAPHVVWAAALVVVLVPVAVMAIVLSGSPYFHYLRLVVPALIALVGVALAAAALLAARAVGPSVLIDGLALGIALLIILPAAYREQSVALDARANAALLHGQLFTAAHDLAWLRPRGGDRMICWGWSPQCYVDAAIAPATRDAINENQLYDTALRPYFRSRFLDDFARSHPDFVIDFAAPGNFGYNRHAPGLPDLPGFEQGIASFPEFLKIIAADFDLVSRVEPPERCPRLYVRRARLAELDRSLIEFASLTATASIAGHPVTALDDRSIFETCADNWLLPDGTLGAASIQFRETAPLGTVAILSSRGGADRVRLSVRLAGEAVVVKHLALEPFPRWTFYHLRQPVAADGLTIEILSYRGAGGGLNEVKAYRD